jgi:cell division septation protein DedD
VLIGLITGGLLAAFFLGFRVGKKEQFDAYASLSLERFPRLPITEEVSSRNVSERLVEEVYEKLQGPSVTLAKDKTVTDELDLKPVKIVPMSEVAASEEKEPSAVSDVIEVQEPNLISSEQPEIQSVEKGSKEHGEKVQPLRDKELKARTVMTLDRLADVDGNQGSPASSTISNETRVDALKEVPVDVPSVKLRAPTVNAASVSSQKHDSHSASESLRSGWYVQLAAFESATEAKELHSLLRQNGFRDSYIQEALVKKRQYFRVLVGPEENSVLAKRLKEQLLREPYLMREPYKGFKPYLKKVD